MRRRFFVQKFDHGRATIEDEAAHHVGRVLRAQPGQLYELSDGSSAWLGRIETVTRDRVDFALIEELPSYVPSLQTTLLLAVVKFDAFEWALEKATELGASRILPLAASRSEKALLSAAQSEPSGGRKSFWRPLNNRAASRSPSSKPLRSPKPRFTPTTRASVFCFPNLWMPCLSAIY